MGKLCAKAFNGPKPTTSASALYLLGSTIESGLAHAASSRSFAPPPDNHHSQFPTTAQHNFDQSYCVQIQSVRGVIFLNGHSNCLRPHGTVAILAQGTPSGRCVRRRPFLGAQTAKGLTRSAKFICSSVQKDVWRKQHSLSCQRPYRVECTGSLPNSEVKHLMVRSL